MTHAAEQVVEPADPRTERDRLAPDFVVIGAQKSASTFIQNCLTDHPDVYLPHGETPYFEDPDYGDADADYFRRLFANRPERMLGIKRPNYIGRPEVPARITRDLPDIRLIAVLRNPVERIVAAYFHQIKYGTLPALPLEEGLRDVLDGGPVLRAWPRSAELLSFGQYARHLEGYRHFLDRGRLLCLLHDDIVADALAAVRSCYDFLGVDPAHQPASLRGRPQKVIYSVGRLRFLGLRNRFLHDYNADRTRLAVRRMNPAEWAVVAAISGIDRYVLDRIVPNDKPRLSAALEARLIDYYRDDVLALQAMLGRDLSHWLRPRAVPSKETAS